VVEFDPTSGQKTVSEQVPGLNTLRIQSVIQTYSPRQRQRVIKILIIIEKALPGRKKTPDEVIGAESAPFVINRKIV